MHCVRQESVTTMKVRENSKECLLKSESESSKKMAAKAEKAHTSIPILSLCVLFTQGAKDAHQCVSCSHHKSARTSAHQRDFSFSCAKPTKFSILSTFLRRRKRPTCARDIRFFCRCPHPMGSFIPQDNHVGKRHGPSPWSSAADCPVCKGAGSQSVVRCVSTISGGKQPQGIYIGLQQSWVKLQLCAFILGMPYLSLGVLRVCLGMGLWYSYSSRWWGGGGTSRKFSPLDTIRPFHLFSTRFSNTRRSAERLKSLKNHTDLYSCRIASPAQNGTQPCCRLSPEIPTQSELFKNSK